jgi:hypothetical protein
MANGAEDLYGALILEALLRLLGLLLFQACTIWFCWCFIYASAGFV